MNPDQMEDDAPKTPEGIRTFQNRGKKQEMSLLTPKKEMIKF